MTVLAMLGLLLVVILFIVEIFWLVQITEAAINFIGQDSGGFFATSNPLAWIITFIILVAVSGLIHIIFRWFNTLAVVAIAGFLSLFDRSSRRQGITNGGIDIGYGLVWLFWICTSAGLAYVALGYFAENPELNSFLAEGDWLATVLTYLAVLGLVFPTGSKND